VAVVVHMLELPVQVVLVVVGMALLEVLLQIPQQQTQVEEVEEVQHSMVVAAQAAQALSSFPTLSPVQPRPRSSTHRDRGLPLQTSRRLIT